MMDKTFKLVIGGALAIGVIASIILLSIGIVNIYDKTIRTSTTVIANGITAPAVENGSVTLSSYPYLQTLTGCVNATGGVNISTGNYSIGEGNRDGGTLVLLDGTFAGQTWNCSALTYKPAFTGSSSIVAFINGLAVFGVFIGILVLAIVSQVVIKQFKEK